MKINVEVDLTPEEARRFFGLPDVSPLQEFAIARLREQMEKGADGTLFPELVRSMVSGGIQSMEAWQSAFSEMLARGSRRSRGAAGRDSDPGEGGA